MADVVSLAQAGLLLETTLYAKSEKVLNTIGIWNDKRPEMGSRITGFSFSNYVNLLIPVPY